MTVKERFDAWLQSEEGQRAMNLFGMGTCDPAHLRNRLWYAFMGGMEAGAAVERERVVKRFAQLIERNPTP